MCRGFTTWPLLSLSSPSVFPRDQMTWNHLSTMCDPIHFIQKDLLTLKKTRDFIARRETNVLRFFFQYIFFYRITVFKLRQLVARLLLPMLGVES